MGERENKLESLGYALDRRPKPAAAYQQLVRDGDVAYLSGALPVDGGTNLVVAGKVPSAIGVDRARHGAALCAANLLRVVYAELGSLHRVRRVVRLAGYVNAEPDFDDAHLVVNGATELLVEVLGEAGRHSRSAVGVAALPLGASVEIDMIVRLEPDPS